MGDVKKVFLSVGDVLRQVAGNEEFRRMASGRETPARIYGVPRGGIPVALAAAALFGFEPVDDPAEADLVVDDLVDSGTTRRRFEKRFPNATFVPLWTKGGDCPADVWLCFPWEESKERDEEDSLARVLEHAGLPVDEKETQALRDYLAARQPTKLRRSP